MIVGQPAPGQHVAVSRQRRAVIASGGRDEVAVTGDEDEHVDFQRRDGRLCQLASTNAGLRSCMYW